MLRYRRALVLLFVVLLILVIIVAALVFSNAHAQAWQQSPNRVVLLPGAVRTGQALMVSFWGAEPNAEITVTVRDTDFWMCQQAWCGTVHLVMPTLLVKTDSAGHGYFALGVPCGYPAGLLRMNIGGMDVAVPVQKGRWCQERMDWVEEVR